MINDDNSTEVRVSIHLHVIAPLLLNLFALMFHIKEIYRYGYKQQSEEYKTYILWKAKKTVIKLIVTLYLMDMQTNCCLQTSKLVISQLIR